MATAMRFHERLPPRPPLLGAWRTLAYPDGIHHSPAAIHGHLPDNGDHDNIHQRLATRHHLRIALPPRTHSNITYVRPPPTFQDVDYVLTHNCTDHANSGIGVR